jgi:hypothetical protein
MTEVSWSHRYIAFCQSVALYWRAVFAATGRCVASQIAIKLSRVCQAPPPIDISAAQESLSPYRMELLLQSYPDLPQFALDWALEEAEGDVYVAMNLLFANTNPAKDEFAEVDKFRFIPTLMTHLIKFGDSSGENESWSQTRAQRADGQPESSKAGITQQNGRPTFWPWGLAPPMERDGLGVNGDVNGESSSNAKIEWYILVTEPYISACCFIDYDFDETTFCDNEFEPHRFCLRCAKTYYETEIGQDRFGR